MCNKYLYIAVWLGSLALIPTGASAHHPGIGGVGGAGGITTIGAGTMEQGEFGLALFVEYTRLKQLSDATLLANIGNDVHGLQSVESRVVALAYGVTNDFTISMRLPFVRRTGILEGVQDDPSDPPSINNRGNTSGFGDVTVLGQYRFLNNLASETQAALLFGFKAPTGRTNLVDPFGETFEAEFQPGSGSWDGFLGAAFSQRLAPLWAFHANVLGVLTGTGTQDTNLGNRVHMPTRVRIPAWSPRPRPQLLPTPTSRLMQCSSSMASGTTSSERPGSSIQTPAAIRSISRRVCG